MSLYLFTPQATHDLLDIWNFIARDNPQAADRVQAACIPRLSNYLIVYAPEEKPLQIIRILHGARDLPSVLTQMFSI
jgi:plasmid stabilization system protein ParE